MFEELAHQYQYRLNNQRIEILSEFESFLYAQTQFLTSEITNIQVLEDIFYQLVDLANALEIVKYIQSLETQIDFQRPIISQERYIDHAYLTIKGHHTFYRELLTNPEKLNTFESNDEGLISIHPYFVTLGEYPQSDISDALNQELKAYLHQFLSHQKQIPAILYNQLHAEDFTVELCSILENPSFQAFQDETNTHHSATQKQSRITA